MLQRATADTDEAGVGIAALRTEVERLLEAALLEDGTGEPGR